VTESDSSANARAGRSGVASARYALGLLVVANTISQIDRQVMYVLVEPVRLDLGLDDSQVGLLVGLGFAFFYTIAAVPLGRLADRANRRNIIALALAAWSAMTALCGVARSFVELLVARIGVGIGEAGCTPSAQSLISDYFPLEQRARALSTYQLGVPIGLLIGLGFGGFLADQLGWRATFFVVGFPGLAMALVVRFSLREPTRGMSDVRVDDRVQPVGEIARFLWRMTTMRHLLVALSLQTLTLSAHGAFNAAFLNRIHGLSLTAAGLQLGLVSGLAGGLGTYAGGWLGDRFAGRDLRWYVWWPMAGAMFSLPFSLFAYGTSDATLAVLSLAFGVVGSYAYSGAGHAIVQSLVKPRMRAVTAAIALFAMNLFGYGLGPWIAGALSDFLGGEESLRYSLMAMNAMMFWACIHYYLASRTYRRDLAAKDE